MCIYIYIFTNESLCFGHLKSHQLFLPMRYDDTSYMSEPTSSVDNKHIKQHNQCQ